VLPVNGLAMIDVFVVGNWIEAAVWMLIAFGLVVQSFRVAPQLRRIQRVLAMAFLLFGVSDIVETQTGAWWRPPWLLAWKAICLATIVVGLWVWIRRANQAGTEQGDHDSQSE
jgi:hypothetical protein